ncbi:MAG: hypothetical protein DKT66_19220 [Candidatus Melainabacteria bacterium]|nr:MAG: hypothetical protein DKT66_19220 [Candidatus Melainabacteria bacterium]
MTKEPSEKLCELPAKAQQLLSNYRSDWDKRLAHAVEPLPDEKYREIIRSFYALLKLSAPLVVSVDSPMQMMLMPALLRIRALADAETWALIQEKITDTAWNKVVSAMNEKISDTDIETLLAQRSAQNSYLNTGGEAEVSKRSASYGIASIFGRPKGKSIDSRLGFFESIVSRLEVEFDAGVTPEIRDWIFADTLFLDGGMPGQIENLHNIDLQAEMIRVNQLRTAVQNLTNMGTTERAALRIFRERGDATSLVRDELVKQGELEEQFLKQLGEETVGILAHALSARNLEPTIYESYPPVLEAIVDGGSSGLWFTGQLAVGFNSIVWHPKLERLSNFTFLLDAGLGSVFSEETARAVNNLRIFLANRTPICPFAEIAFVTKQPLLVSLDDDLRFHSTEGPVLQYADGFSMYAVNGVTVAEKTAVSPETLTVQEIESEINLEVRRIMMERFGIPRYLMESKADIINEDQYGTLYRKRMSGDEPLVMVRVKNSTAEPDGSFREYFLRVPPYMQTAKEAVAWTFNIDEEQYHPQQET